MKQGMKTLTLTNADGTEHAEHRLSEEQAASLSRIAERMSWDSDAGDGTVQELLCDLRYWSPRD